MAVSTAIEAVGVIAGFFGSANARRKAKRRAREARIRLHDAATAEIERQRWVQKQSHEAITAELEAIGRQASEQVGISRAAGQSPEVAMEITRRMLEERVQGERRRAFVDLSTDHSIAALHREVAARIADIAAGVPSKANVFDLGLGLGEVALGAIDTTQTAHHTDPGPTFPATPAIQSSPGGTITVE